MQFYHNLQVFCKYVAAEAKALAVLKFSQISHGLRWSLIPAFFVLYESFGWNCLETVDYIVGLVNVLNDIFWVPY